MRRQRPPRAVHSDRGAAVSGGGASARAPRRRAVRGPAARRLLRHPGGQRPRRASQGAGRQPDTLWERDARDRPAPARTAVRGRRPRTQGGGRTPARTRSARPSPGGGRAAALRARLPPGAAARDRPRRRERRPACRRAGRLRAEHGVRVRDRAGRPAAAAIPLLRGRTSWTDSLRCTSASASPAVRRSRPTPNRVDFGLALGKIFLYDLANLSSLARAFSFLAVGGVLLVAALVYQRLTEGRAPAV